MNRECFSTFAYLMIVMLSNTHLLVGGRFQTALKFQKKNID